MEYFVKFQKLYYKLSKNTKGIKAKRNSSNHSIKVAHKYPSVDPTTYVVWTRTKQSEGEGRK